MVNTSFSETPHFLPASDLPVSNRPATIMGSSISIQVLAVVAASLRLFARSQLAHGLGIDDLFVVLSCIATTIGTTYVAIQPNIGLGQHQWDVTFPQFEQYLHYTFGAICAYVVSATCIKISIIYQYYRVARSDNVGFRRICFAMIVIVSVWGLVFFFGTLLSCVPVNHFWNYSVSGHCILFGSTDPNVKVDTYIAQASSNMMLDVTIFIMPIYLLKNTNLSRKAKIGLLGVFAIGSLVVIISILRLISITRHQLGLTLEKPDVTFYSPLTVIWSCIEVNIAVLSASIPIFWPVISSLTFGKIIVTNEVEVTSDLAGSRNSSRIGISGVDGRFDDEQELTYSSSWGNTFQKGEVGILRTV